MKTYETENTSKSYVLIVKTLKIDFISENFSIHWHYITLCFFQFHDETFIT